MEYLNFQEALINAIRKRDLTEVNRCLYLGANATTVYNHTNGIVQAVLENTPEILEVLLKSCIHKGLTTQQLPIAPVHHHVNSSEYCNELSLQIQNDGKQPNFVDVSAAPCRYSITFAEKYKYNQTALQFCDAHRPIRAGNTPIHLAARYGAYECAVILLKYYSPVDVINEEGKSPLYLAVNHETKMLSLLLAHNANMHLKEKDDGNTALHKATLTANLGTVLLLCKAGVNVNEFNFEGRTAIYYAIKHSQYGIVRHLLSYGATLINPTMGEYLYQRRLYLGQDTSMPFNPITEKTELLRYKNVNPHLLHDCISFISVRMAKILISHLDFEQINQVDRQGHGLAPLMLAIKLSEYDLIEYILLNGARDVIKFRGTKESCHSFHLAITYCKDLKLFRKVICILFLRGFRIHKNFEDPSYTCISTHKFNKAAILLKEGVVSRSEFFDIFDYLWEYETRQLARNFVKFLANIGLTETEVRSHNRKRYWWWNKRLKKMVTKERLSLKALCRISIHCRLVCKMNAIHINVQSSTYDLIKTSFGCSVLRYLITLTGLPQTLQDYVYDFNDVPSIESVK